MAIVTVICKTRRPGPFPADRRCLECPAVLNRYHAGPYCYPCEIAVEKRGRRELQEAA